MGNMTMGRSKKGTPGGTIKVGVSGPTGSSYSSNTFGSSMRSSQTLPVSSDENLAPFQSTLTRTIGGNSGTNTPLATPKPTPTRGMTGRGGRGSTGRKSEVRKILQSKDDEITRLRSQLEALSKPTTPATPICPVADSEDDIANECPLCMSPLKRRSGNNFAFDRYTIITKCGHQFHLDCLQSVRECKDDAIACPMCREELPPGITPGKKSSGPSPVMLPTGPRGAFQPPRYVRPAGLPAMPLLEGEEDEEEGAAEQGGANLREGRRRNGRSKACVVM